jgi:hypothetical protein
VFRQLVPMMIFCSIAKDTFCCRPRSVALIAGADSDLLPIALPSSPAVANTHVGCSAAFGIHLRIAKIKSIKRKAVTTVVKMNCPLNAGVTSSPNTFIKDGFNCPLFGSLTLKPEKTNKLTQLFPR